MRPLAGAVLAIAIAIAILAAGPAREAVGDPPAQPNFIIVLTDDQPYSMMDAMPATRSLIGGQGIDFRRSYISFPLCCPARASLFSGLHMHNHGVRGNGGAFGGWHRFRDGGSKGEQNALPVRLGGAGYYSVGIGKYMNGYHAGQGLHVPPGWDEWYGRIGGEIDVFHDYTLVEKGPSGIPAAVFYGDREEDYSTDVLAGKALDFIDRANGVGQPFLLYLSVAAPHHPYIPAQRHLHSREHSPIGPRPGFNEKDFRDKPRWLRREAPRRLSLVARQRVNEISRRRDETLISVDESVQAIVHALEQQGLGEDTYVIFTSDNGIFRGEHRIQGGKYLPHEPSSRVPLLIRGPGIAPGSISDELISNVDLTATMLELAGIPDPSLDGRSLAPFLQNPQLRTSRPLLIEGDTGPGRGIGGAYDPDLLGMRATASRSAVRRAGLIGRKGVKNLDMEAFASQRPATGDRAPAYRAIRTDRYLFVIYGTGDLELYDMFNDPGQMRSLARAPRFAPVRQWLFGRLLQLARCGGPQCNTEIGNPPAPLNAKQLRARRLQRSRR